MTDKTSSVDELLDSLQNRYPHMPEFYQAVCEVSGDVIPFIHARNAEHSYRNLKYLTKPDQVISFRISWQDDQNRMHLNRGYRVQFSNALGPYKGGLRLNSDLSLSVLYIPWF